MYKIENKKNKYKNKNKNSKRKRKSKKKYYRNREGSINSGITSQNNSSLASGAVSAASARYVPIDSENDINRQISSLKQNAHARDLVVGSTNVM